jgi:hypothetical protein
MKAIHVYGRGGPEGLVYEDAEQPRAPEGEVLVRVYAMGVTPTELTWSAAYQTKADSKRTLPLPGHDLSRARIHLLGDDGFSSQDYTSSYQEMSETSSTHSFDTRLSSRAGSEAKTTITEGEYSWC